MRSVSHERTFRSLSAWEDLKAKCEELTRLVADDLQAKGLKGKTLTLKLKDVDFSVRAHYSICTLCLHPGCT